MVDGHYFFQDIYVAKLAHSLGCKHVYDIGSRIDGYISHLLCLDINVTMIDIRPLDASVEGLDFLQGNATDLSSVDDESIEFLSSLHALEHFGLGRYGDPVDYIAWKKALKQMQKKIKVGGRLCLSVPIGNLEKLAFNAQRIFLPNTIVEEFDENILVERFAYIHEGRIVEFKFNIGDDYNRYFNNIKNDIGECDCGIFLFRKID